DVLRCGVRIRARPPDQPATRDVPRGRNHPRCDRRRYRRNPRPKRLSLPDIRGRRPICRRVDGAGRGDREGPRIPRRRGGTPSREAPQPEQRVLRPGRPRRVPLPCRPPRCRVWGERRRRRILGPPRGRRRIHQSARAGLRVVQHRIAALRRAVLTEVEDINRLIYHILRGGVVVSVAFLLFGFILAGVTGRPLPEHSIPPRALGPDLIPFTPTGYLN